MEILGVKIERKKKKAKEAEIPLDIPTARNFEAYVQSRMDKTGMSASQVVEETFHDGYLTFMVEESGSGSAKIDASQMFKAKKPKETVEELIRLRRKFGPVSTCVDWIRDNMLGSGVGVQIDKADDKFQKEIKEYTERLIDDIYQDEYARSLQILLPILVDEALTTGVSAAEITYEKPKDLTFMKYANVIEGGTTVKVDGKDTEIIYFGIKEPKWTDLGGITRLKIMDKAYKRFELQRDPKSWEAKYWIVDGPQKAKVLKTDSGITIRKFIGKIPKGEYLHTWQVFWLALNREGYSERGQSVIMPVLSMAQLLEKILNAVGEGIHRAGNKKYFIVCGTEKRPWSGPHVRNVLQQLREASQKNWSTIPMPRGFGVEEIGGEIFEAKDVVEYFKKIIARGMHVPASVLGVGDAVKEPKTNLTLLRINLAIAIKHQLFKHHIWCNYGKKKGKQGGRAEKVTYIPDAKFKVTDLLSVQEELDLYKTMLNPANPVQGAVKLEVERAICRLMGWDVILPTQEEYRKEQEELAKKMEKDEKAAAKAKKEQGDPIPQNLTRQKKRLKGMTKEEGSQKGVAKDLGGTRVPKEVQETKEGAPVPVLGEIKLSINVDSKPIETEPIKTEPVKVEIGPIKTEPSKIEVTLKQPEKKKVDVEAEKQKKKSEKEKLEAEKELAKERLETEKKKRELLEKIEKKVS